MFRFNLTSVKMLVLLLTISALQTWMVFLKSRLYIDASTATVIFSLFALLLIINALVLTALHFIARHWSIPSKVTVANGTLTIVIVIATFHYYLFKEHLNSENIRFVIEGVLHGEAGIDINVIAKVIAAIVVIYLFIAAIAHAVWRPYRSAPSAHGAINLKSMALVLIGINVFSFSWRWSVHATDTSYDAQAYIPWVHFLSEQEQPKIIEFDPPIVRNGFFELDDLNRLAQEKKLILAGDIQAERRPNILFVHMESLRSSMFNPENMPNLYRQSQSTLQTLPAHFTTGPNTGLGIHGLINGLADTYYQAARQYWFKPITLSVLKKLNYQMSVYATHDLIYEQHDELFFNETLDHLKLVDNGDIVERERRMVDNYIEDLRHDGGRPRFDYVIFFSTHFDYYFPEEFARYQPVQKLGFDIHDGKNPDKRPMRTGLFNRYSNATLYVDHLVNRIVEYLRESGRLDNTVVVITGDHGEEFWEHGAFGHQYGLVNEQIRVPALMHFPQRVPVQYKVTSHQDFFPTIFDYMKLRTANGTCNFMTGHSLYQYDPENDYAMASLGVTHKSVKFTEMLIGKGYKIRFDFKDTLRVTGVFDSEDQPLTSFDQQAVRDLIQRAVNAKRNALASCNGGVSP